MRSFMSRLQPPAPNYLRPVSRQSHYDSEKSLRQPGIRLQSPCKGCCDAHQGGAFAPRGPANIVNSKPIAPNPKIPAEIAAHTARLRSGRAIGGSGYVVKRPVLD